MTTSTKSAAMELMSYTRGEGWSCSPFPPLDSPSTLVLAFGARSYFDDPAVWRDLHAAYPTSIVVGCSTAGEIRDDRLVDESVSVAVYRMARTRLAAVSAPVRNAADSFHAGDTIGRQLSGPGLRAVFVLSDGLKVNGSELVRGLSSSLPPSVTITGGLAGDGSKFEKTWVLRNGAPCDGFATAVGFYGDHVKVGHGCKGGWDVFGPERIVTRAEGNVLYELDGRPALPLYKEYLGALAAGLPSTALLFPLSLRQGPSHAKSLVRTILSVDESHQSMVFAGDIPQGYTAQLMRAQVDRLIGGAGDSAAMATGDSTPGPVLAVAVSCVGRRLVLGERTEEELERTLEALPPGSRQVGFYSYGEVSPFVAGSCDLHNQTMTLTTFSEA